MSKQEELIYPPGWGNEQEEAEDFAKELVRGAGMQFADITIKWGSRYAQMEHIAVFRSKLWGIEPHITIIANAREEQQSVLIRKKDQEGVGAYKVRGAETLKLPLPAGQAIVKTPSGLETAVRKEAGLIEWDINLTIQEAVELLINIDNEAEKRGLFDPDKKQRKPLSEPVYIPMPKLKVEEFFSEIGATYLSIDQEPEKLLEQFDHPKELVIWHSTYTGEPVGLIHKRDVDYLEKREQIINDVLIERGLTMADLHQVLRSGFEVLGPIAKGAAEEVRKRTKNLLEVERIKRAPPHEDEGAEAARPAMIAYYEDRIDDVKRIFDEVLERFPNSSLAAHDYAVILVRIDGLEAALPYFIKATEREPKDFIHFLQAAKCLFQLGKEEEGFELLRSALELDEARERMEEKGLTAKKVLTELREGMKDMGFETTQS